MAPYSNIYHLFYFPLIVNITWINYLLGIVLHIHKALGGNISSSDCASCELVHTDTSNFLLIVRLFCPHFYIIFSFVWQTVLVHSECIACFNSLVREEVTMSLSFSSCNSANKVLCIQILVSIIKGTISEWNLSFSQVM